jgi:hypothetical protein
VEPIAEPIDSIAHLLVPIVDLLHYLLTAAINLRSLGPALGLAPDADFDDGKLDVVVVHPEHRAALHAHLEARGAGGRRRAPRRARRGGLPRARPHGHAALHVTVP